VGLQQQEKLRALTSLRFFAAFWVLVYHTWPRAGIGTNAELRVVDLGHAAVGLFFILSGFILRLVYRELRGGAGLRRFWVARFARVYPMYVVSLLADLPRLLLYRVAKYGAMKGAALIGATLGGQLLLLHAWIPSLGGLNFPSWSISTEAFFYLLFPLALPLARSVRSPVATILLMLAMWAILLATALLVHADELFWYNPAVRLPEFLVGILLANLFLGDWSDASRSRFPALVYVGGSVAWAVVVAVVLAPVDPGSRLAEVLLMPAFVIAILTLAAALGPVSRLASVGWLVLLGEASYALYLIHAPVHHWWSTFLGTPTDLLRFAGYVALTVALSIAAHLWIEKPARDAVMGWWDRRQSRRRAAAEAGSLAPKVASRG
jgi:peptidoglycan/LPS O-acetylase OafA/YrhL